MFAIAIVAQGCGSSGTSDQQAPRGGSAGSAGSAGGGSGGAAGSGGSSAGAGGTTEPVVEPPVLNWSQGIQPSPELFAFEPSLEVDPSGGVRVFADAAVFGYLPFSDAGWGALDAVPDLSGSLRGTVSASSGSTAVFAYDATDTRVTPLVGGVWQPTLDLGPGYDVIGLAASGTSVLFANWDMGEPLQARFFSGGAWSEPATLGSPFAGERTMFSVDAGLGADGRAVVVTEDIVSAEEGGVSAVFFDGAAWGAPEVVTPSDGTRAAGTTFAMNESGQGFVVWRDDGLLWGRALDLGSGLGEPFQLSSGERSPQLARIAVNAGGQAVVAWSEYAPLYESDGIHVRRYDPGQGWLPEDTVFQYDGADGSGQVYIYVMPSIDDQGRILLGWPWLAGGSVQIYTALFVPGRGWSAPTIAAEDVRTGTEGQPDVALSGEQAFVVWAAAFTSEDQIYITDYQLLGAHAALGD